MLLEIILNEAITMLVAIVLGDTALHPDEASYKEKIAGIVFLHSSWNPKNKHLCGHESGDYLYPSF